MAVKSGAVMAEVSRGMGVALSDERAPSVLFDRPESLTDRPPQPN
jgi:hypothetical protein